MLHHDQLGRDKTIKHAKAEQTAAGGDGCSHPPTLAQRVWELPAARGHRLPAPRAGGGGSDDSGDGHLAPALGHLLGTHSPTGLSFFFSSGPALHTELFYFPQHVTLDGFQLQTFCLPGECPSSKDTAPTLQAASGSTHIPTCYANKPLHRIVLKPLLLFSPAQALFSVTRSK